MHEMKVNQMWGRKWRVETPIFTSERGFEFTRDA
jgi:hypothetical protein